MKMEMQRQQIVEFGRQMSAQGLSRGTSGNLSCYDPECGLMAISPSGLDYFATAPEDVVVMTLDGTVVEGPRTPSSEHALHAAVYRCHPEARGVVHAHSIYCTTLACLRRGVEAVHYAMSGAGVDTVPCLPYATFGTPELARVVAENMGASRAVLLANHGMVACGGSLSEAFSLAVNVEFTAEMQWRCMAVGEPVVLSASHMAAVRERMKTYGQSDRPRGSVGY